MDAKGRAYVVWSDCRFEAQCSASDLVLTTSDNGIAWSHPTRIPADAIGSGVDHFVPGLAVDRSTSDGAAHLVLAFYYYPQANCTTATCQLNAGFTASADGGSSWTSTTKVAGPMALTWLPNTTQGFMVGDYISTSFSGAPAFPAYAVASAPASGLFQEAIFTITGGLSSTASAIAASDTSGFGNTNAAATTNAVTTQ